MENCKKEVTSYKKAYGKRTNDTHSWYKLKTKDKSELLDSGSIIKQEEDLTQNSHNKNTNETVNSKKERGNRVSNIYPNNFNFFLKNSTSNTYRTELNRRSNDKRSNAPLQSPCIRVFNKVNHKLSSTSHCQQNELGENFYKDMKNLN